MTDSPQLPEIATEKPPGQQIVTPESETNSALPPWPEMYKFRRSTEIFFALHAPDLSDELRWFLYVWEDQVWKFDCVLENHHFRDFIEGAEIFA